MIFSSYQEAYDYGDWYCRAIVEWYAFPKDILVTIYTTGPNDNGWWYAAQPPFFNAYD